jgi:hypothetical protein
MHGALTPVPHPEIEISKFVTLAQASAAWDQSGGLTTQIGWLGNMYKSDCVEAAEQHGRIFKALVSFVNNVVTFEPGFRQPHKAFTLEEYYDYEAWAGIPGFEPDQGTEPFAYAQWLYKQGQIDAYGMVGVAPYTVESFATIKSAAETFRGLLLTIGCPPQMSTQFFNNEVLTVAPDNQPNWDDGHGIWLCGFNDETQRAKIATWGTVCECTYEFLITCMTGALVFLTKEDAAAKAVNLPALEAALMALPEPSNTPSVDAPAVIVVPDDELHKLLSKIREEVDKTPEGVKFFIKELHKVADAAMERVTEQELIRLFELALKVYR